MRARGASGGRRQAAAGGGAAGARRGPEAAACFPINATLACGCTMAAPALQPRPALACRSPCSRARPPRCSLASCSSGEGYDQRPAPAGCRQQRVGGGPEPWPPRAPSNHLVQVVGIHALVLVDVAEEKAHQGRLALLPLLLHRLLRHSGSPRHCAHGCQVATNAAASRERPAKAPSRCPRGAGRQAGGAAMLARQP